MTIDRIADKVRAGERLSADEALALYRARADAAARPARRRRPRAQAPRRASSPTSSTATSTTRTSASPSAASARSTGRSDRPTATCSASTSCSGRSTRRSRSAAASCCCRAATTPTCRSTWYEDLFRAIKERYPGVQAARAVAAGGASTSRGCRSCRCRRCIDRLIAAGLDSIPGGGAEILVDRVRKLLHCYGKATADEWLDVMRHAHRAGLRTTATMMYGTVETDEERLEHMLRLRDAAGRDRRLHRVHRVELSAGAHRAGRHRGDRRRLPAHAGDRAPRARQLRQPAGVVGDAGRQGRAAEPRLRRQRHGQRDDRGERRPRRRRQLLHGRSRDRPEHRGRRASSPSAATCTTRSSAGPIFRERDVPRMLELATARADGDTSACPRSCATIPPAAARASSCASSTELIRYHAALGPADQPSRPIRDGWVAVDRGRIVARRPPRGRAPTAMRDVDLGDVAVLPGLVNAHTHLELSYLRDEVPPASAFVTWVRGVMAARRAAARSRARREILAARRARRSPRRSRAGTAVVGDVSNTLVDVRAARRAARWRPSCSTS